MSSNHASLAYNSQAYWDFTFDGLAEDVRANMRDVFIDSGFKKGYYFGYSAGSIQMEIALSKYDSELKNYLIGPSCWLHARFLTTPLLYQTLSLASFTTKWQWLASMLASVRTSTQMQSAKKARRKLANLRGL